MQSGTDSAFTVISMRRNGRHIRAVAAGHSWSEGTVPVGATRDQRGIIVLGPDNFAAGHLSCHGTCFRLSSTVTPELEARFPKTADGVQLAVVPPGTPQFVLVEKAHRLGYYLPGAGAVEDVTLGGFVANGCHGTGIPHMPGAAEDASGAPKDMGARYPGPVSESVAALEVLSFEEGPADEPRIVRTLYGASESVVAAAFEGSDGAAAWTADPRIVRTTRVVPDSDASRGLWDAVRAHLGMFGIITRIGERCFARCVFSLCKALRMDPSQRSSRARPSACARSRSAWTRSSSGASSTRREGAARSPSC